MTDFMKSFFIVILLVNFSFAVSDTVQVTIEIYAPNKHDSTKIFIAGNNDEMANWQPDLVVLNNRGNHLWQKSFIFEKGRTIEYKITLGSYDNEAADSSGKPFQNSGLKVNNDTTARSTILYWKKSNNLEVMGQITGQVRYHKDVQADGLPARDIIVWLPPGYSEDSERRYPVLYMHDGQNIVDPNTAAFKVDWQIDETADSLIRAGEIEPLIVVGIYNTKKRNKEYLPGLESDLYKNFVIHTLKPLIDQTYRTKPGAEHTANGGASAGATIAFMLAWGNPHVFSKAICLSPAFKIDEIDIVSDVFDYSGVKKDLHIIIYNGGIGLEEKLQPGVDAMIKALEEKGYLMDVDYFYIKDKNARHFEAAWAVQMPVILKLFYGIDKQN